MAEARHPYTLLLLACFTPHEAPITSANRTPTRVPFHTQRQASLRQALISAENGRAVAASAAETLRAAFDVREAELQAQLESERGRFQMALEQAKAAGAAATAAAMEESTAQLRAEFYVREAELVRSLEEVGVRCWCSLLQP